MPAIRIQSTRRDEDYALIVTVARLLYQHGLTQSQIAKEIGTSPSTVSRMLEKAKNDGIVKVFIDPPPIGVDRKHQRLQKDLKHILEKHKVRDVHLTYRDAWNGERSGNNVSNLGLEGARVLLESIFRLAEKKDFIKIGMGCGETLRSLVDNFADILSMYPSYVEHLKEVTIEVYPLAHYKDFNLLHAMYPNDVVSKFFHIQEKYKNKLKIKPRYVSIPLPEDFYNDDSKANQKDFFVRAIQEAREADIFLLGIGSVAGNSIYKELYGCIMGDSSPNSSIDDKEFVAEINHIPISSTGFPDDRMQKRTVAVKINDFKEKMERDEKYVIAIAGGKNKKEAIRASVRDPCFNVLITDTEIAEYLIEECKED